MDKDVCIARYEKMLNKGQDEQLYNYFLVSNEYIELTRLKGIIEGTRGQVPVDVMQDYVDIKTGAYRNMILYLKKSINDNSYQEGLDQIIEKWTQGITSEGLLMMMCEGKEYTRADIITSITNNQIVRPEHKQDLLFHRLDQEGLDLETIEEIYKHSDIATKLHKYLSRLLKGSIENCALSDDVIKLDKISIKNIEKVSADKTRSKGLDHTFAISNQLYKAIFINESSVLELGKEGKEKKSLSYSLNYSELQEQYKGYAYKRYLDNITLVRRLYSGVCDYVFDELEKNTQGIEDEVGHLSQGIISIDIPLSRLHTQIGNKKKATPGEKALYKYLLYSMGCISVVVDVRKDFEKFQQFGQFQDKLLDVSFDNKLVNGILSEVATVRANTILIYMYCKHQYIKISQEANEMPGRATEDKQKIYLYIKSQLTNLLEGKNNKITFSTIQEREDLEKTTTTNEAEDYKRFRKYCVDVMEHTIKAVNNSNIYNKTFSVDVDYKVRHPKESDGMIIKSRKKSK